MEDKKKSWFARHKVLTVILVLIGLGVVGSAFSDTPTTTPTTHTEPSAAEETATETTPEKINIEAAYKKIKTGMSKSEVEKVTERESDDCVESEFEGLGTSESCNYGDFDGMIIVTYDDGKVSSKTKSNF